MKLNYKFFILLFFISAAFTACEKSAVQEAPATDNSISDFNFLYNYPDTSWAYKGTPNQIMSIKTNALILDHSMNISNDTVYVYPEVPNGVPKGQLSNIKLTQIWGTATIPGTASIGPVNGAPVLGTRGDYSKPVTYVVTAADGSTKQWVIVTAPLPALNKYDGYYTATGSLTDHVNGSIVGFYPWNVALATTSPNSVVVVDQSGITNDRYHSISLNGSNSNYGEFTPVFTFDNNNNVTSVTNYWGQPSPSRGRSAQIDPTGVNKWDPATKLLKVKYWMVENGNQRTSFDETYTWTGQR
jgi:hypothetical protein